VVSPVKLRYGHHVANLGVFVCLGTKEGLSVGHGDGFFGSLGKSLEVAEISSGVDKSSTCIK
jgi:hypothetical protein